MAFILTRIQRGPLLVSNTHFVFNNTCAGGFGIGHIKLRAPWRLDTIPSRNHLRKELCLLCRMCSVWQAIRVLWTAIIFLTLTTCQAISIYLPLPTAKTSRYARLSPHLRSTARDQGELAQHTVKLDKGESGGRNTQLPFLLLSFAVWLWRPDLIPLINYLIKTHGCHFTPTDTTEMKPETVHFSAQIIAAFNTRSPWWILETVTLDFEHRFLRLGFQL